MTRLDAERRADFDRIGGYRTEMLSQPVPRSKVSWNGILIELLTFGLLSHALGFRSSTYSLTTAVLTRHELKVLFYVDWHCSCQSLNVEWVKVRTLDPSRW